MAHLIPLASSGFPVDVTADATLWRPLGVVKFAVHSTAVPALLKPDQGGSGARIQVVESLAQVEAIFAADPSLSLPDNLFLLQEDLYAGSRSGQCLTSDWCTSSSVNGICSFLF